MCSPSRRRGVSCQKILRRGESIRHLVIYILIVLFQNFISVSTIRDITSLRQEFLSTLISLNLLPHGSTPSIPALNTHSSHVGLIKAIILAGLWPRVARVSLPKGAIKFDRVQAGTVQRANEAKEYKFYDIRVSETGSRVFLHPASVLFHSAEWKSPFVTYFQKQQTTKLFLRDATEVSATRYQLRLACLFSLRIDSNIRHAFIRGTCHCKSYRWWAYNWQQGCLRQAEGLAAYWSSRKSAAVGMTVHKSFPWLTPVSLVDFLTCS